MSLGVPREQRQEKQQEQQQEAREGGREGGGGGNDKPKCNWRRKAKKKAGIGFGRWTTRYDRKERV
jgi:hypothetical protein